MKKIAWLAVCIFLLAGTTPGFCLRFNPHPLMHKAGNYLEQGRFLECIQTYHQVYEFAAHEETKKRALVRMADVLALFTGQKQKAIVFYEQALKEFSASASGLENAYFNSAMLYYELGRMEEASSRFKAFVHTYPGPPRVFTAEYMLERIKWERGKENDKEKTEPIKEKNIPLIRVSLGSDFPLRVILGRGGNLFFRENSRQLPPGEYSFDYRGGNFVFQGKALAPTAEIKTKAGFSLGGNKYLGDILFTRNSKNPVLVNKIRLEKYLLGVVPREMSPSWKLQALKAQAVAARSYAYYLVLHSRDKPYDVAATTASQVYGGAEAGNPTTDRAVNRTRGEVLVYKDKPVLSYFHSHSGGVLEDAGKVWTTSLPYYKAVPDPISMEYKDMSWKTAISGSELARSLRKNGFEAGTIRNVSPAERSSSGRISRVRISTAQEDFEISSNSLRIWLGAGKIKSTLCSIEKNGGKYIFSGRGFGHGVGMSQWGAQGMAENGEGYQRILEHYYPQTELRKLW